MNNQEQGLFCNRPPLALPEVVVPKDTGFEAPPPPPEGFHDDAQVPAYLVTDTEGPEFGLPSAEELQAYLARPQAVKREGPKVGRNKPCPCGSGKKSKRCHPEGV